MDIVQVQKRNEHKRHELRVVDIHMNNRPVEIVHCVVISEEKKIATIKKKKHNINIVFECVCVQKEH